MSARSRLAVALSAAALVSGVVAVATPAAASPAPVHAGQPAVSADEVRPLARCAIWRRTTANYSGNTAGYSWAWEVVIQQGATGDRVREIQCLLDWWGAYGGALDGQFGPGTAAGVREVQARCRISADGVVGPATWRCIRQGGPV